MAHLPKLFWKEFLSRDYLKHSTACGILVQNEKGSYAFLHKTLQEFLAIQYIKASPTYHQKLLSCINDRMEDTGGLLDMFIFLCGSLPQIAEKVSVKLMDTISEKSVMRINTRRKPIFEQMKYAQDMIYYGFEEALSCGHPNIDLRLTHVVCDLKLPYTSGPMFQRFQKLLETNIKDVESLYTHVKGKSSLETLTETILEKSSKSLCNLTIKKNNNTFNFELCKQLKYLNVYNKRRMTGEDMHTLLEKIEALTELKYLRINSLELTERLPVPKCLRKLDLHLVKIQDSTFASLKRDVETIHLEAVCCLTECVFTNSEKADVSEQIVSKRIQFQNKYLCTRLRTASSQWPVFGFSCSHIIEPYTQIAKHSKLFGLKLKNKTHEKLLRDVTIENGQCVVDIMIYCHGLLVKRKVFEHVEDYIEASKVNPIVAQCDNVSPSVFIVDVCDRKNFLKFVDKNLNHTTICIAFVDESLQTESTAVENVLDNVIESTCSLVNIGDHIDDMLERFAFRMFRPMIEPLIKATTRYTTNLDRAHDMKMEMNQIVRQSEDIYNRSSVPSFERPHFPNRERRHFSDSELREVLSIDKVVSCGEQNGVLIIYVEDGLDIPKRKQLEETVFNTVKNLGIEDYLIKYVGKDTQHLHVSVGDQVHNTDKMSGTLGCFAKRYNKEPNLRVSDDKALETKPITKLVGGFGDSKFSTNNRSEAICGIVSRHVVANQNILLDNQDKNLGEILHHGNCNFDISAIVLNDDIVKNCIFAFKSKRNKPVKCSLYTYSLFKEEMIDMDLSGHDVHIWGACSRPGIGTISATKYMQKTEEVSGMLITIKDKDVTSKNFSEEGDSGAIVCLTDKRERHMKALAILIGKVIGEKQKTEVNENFYIALRLESGFHFLNKEHEAEFVLHDGTSE
ncbi:hypothetical protein MAR_005077 [Mya arenaria]|uniref:Uncharacterized protein n=1 Tax=Mya arenaria TaxID=6604 RepID=A0ABY7F040_MYAAR|nr:uncharacterized protein LOC128202923 [Mya arenaria]XP_052760062.1 uncharacterized protein LOC128202923 [Mya arenaria]XP_052760063.1 uncharacterized protein LOC128202923 [Mya arenaria]XP_052760064.1 uncharacterized protein LOC128202923 [Mya arenaria]XP_052760065.1 uncharacterized protein LOC128202923 [Mya arenaria]WAR14972.1 hypothetical protein MAR_005077 [Mya arenaria]